MSTRAGTSGKVFNKHINRDNSGNNIGRQVQSTSEVTHIGPHIAFKLQPNPTVIDQVIHHPVHCKAISRIRIQIQSSIRPHCELFHIQIHSDQTIELVYLQHNGRTAHLPTAHIPLALPRTSRRHLKSGKVMSPLHWKCPTFPKTDGMPASSGSWVTKVSSNGNTLTSPKTSKEGKYWRMSSPPSPIP